MSQPSACLIGHFNLLMYVLKKLATIHCDFANVINLYGFTWKLR